MITIFNEYIKENKEIDYSIIKTIYNRMKTFYNFEFVELKYTTNYYNHVKEYCDITLTNKLNDIIMFRICIFDDSTISILKDGSTELFSFKESARLYKYYKDYINNYYNNYNSDLNYINNIAILDLQRYLQFIIKCINENKFTLKRYLKFLKILKDENNPYYTRIKTYFDENFEQYYNASKFDLI
jgi:hypothetical protein